VLLREQSQLTVDGALRDALAIGDLLDAQTRGPELAELREVVCLTRSGRFGT